MPNVPDPGEVGPGNWYSYGYVPPPPPDPEDTPQQQANNAPSRNNTQQPNNNAPPADGNNNASPPDGTQQDNITGDNGRCLPDPCFKSAFENPDMTPEQMQAEVNQNRMKINEQRLQAVDGGPEIVPIFPETMFFPEAGGAAAFLSKSDDPNSVKATVAAKSTENVIGLDAAAEAGGEAVGTAAKRIPIIGPVISTPAKNVTTWGIKQGGGAVIDAGAEHVYSTKPE
jgi:hypothetical protein